MTAHTSIATSLLALGALAAVALPHSLRELAGRADAALARLPERLRETVRYQRAVTELRHLDDRDLEDIGVARGQLSALARRHARGMPPLAPQEIARAL